VHPTPVYEMIAYVAVFAVLWSVRKRPRPDGTLFWWYLVLAPGARFLVEFYRINPVLALDLSTAQWFSLLLVAIGGWRLLAARRTTPARIDRVPEPARR
jgi:phosphatidylglycerol:prolipoprotein diacylglycerol transferase